MVNGEVLLDLDYTEDVAAAVDCNLVMTQQGEWVEVQATAEGAAYDYFGSSVAVSGDTAVIGAYLDDNDNGTNAGLAYVFEKPAAGWETTTETVRVTASDGAAGDQFGWSAAISGDTALIGARTGENNGIPTGSAYVVTEPDGGWEYVPYPIYEDAKLTASDGAADDYFGVFVAISGDTAVIGSYLDDNDNGTDSGSAYVFGGLSDCNTSGTLDSCDIADGTSPDVNTNGVPDECECFSTGVRSCLDHDGMVLCLDMGVSDGVEPRMGGVTELEIDLDDASGVTQVVSVYCEDVSTNQVPWGGAVPFAVTSGGGDTVIAQFSPALPDETYCQIDLDCGAEICVRSCEGDVNRDGETTTSDASAIKLRFGQAATDANCEWDFDLSGDINTSDYSQVKLRFGKTAPECP